MPSLARPAGPTAPIDPAPLASIIGLGGPRRIGKPADVARRLAAHPPPESVPVGVPAVCLAPAMPVGQAEAERAFAVPTPILILNLPGGPIRWLPHPPCSPPNRPTTRSS